MAALRQQALELRDGRFIAVLVPAAAAFALLFVLSAYLLHPLALPGVLLAAGFAALAFAKPAIGLAGALAATALEAFGLPLPSGTLTPAEFALALAGGAWVVRALVRPETVALPGLRDATVGALLLIILLGVTVAVEPAPVLRVFVLWSLFFFLYLQAQSLSLRGMQLVIVGFAAGAGVLGAVGTYAYLTAGSVELFGGGEFTTVRAVGALADANYYAALLLLALLPALALLLARGRRFLWLLAPIALILLGIVFSLSRGGISALVFGLLVVLLWRRARWVAAGLLVVFALLTVFNVNPITRSQQFTVVEERLSTITRPETRARSLRPRIWEAATNAAIEHPFLGVGFNQYEFQAVRRGVFERGKPIENAHNLYLSIAAEAGLIALALFIAFLGQLAVRARDALRTRGVQFALALGLTAALVAFAVQGMTVVQMRANVVTAAFFVLAGMLTGLADRARRERDEAV